MQRRRRRRRRRRRPGWMPWGGGRGDGGRAALEDLCWIRVNVRKGKWSGEALPLRPPPCRFCSRCSSPPPPTPSPSLPCTPAGLLGPASWSSCSSCSALWRCLVRSLWVLWERGQVQLVGGGRWVWQAGAQEVSEQVAQSVSTSGSGRAPGVASPGRPHASPAPSAAAAAKGPGTHRRSRRCCARHPRRLHWAARREEVGAWSWIHAVHGVRMHVSPKNSKQSRCSTALAMPSPHGDARASPVVQPVV